MSKEEEFLKQKGLRSDETWMTDLMREYADQQLSDFKSKIIQEIHKDGRRQRTILFMGMQRNHSPNKSIMRLK